jgi:membrane protein DedA with SNARE-associated domain
VFLARFVVGARFTAAWLVGAYRMRWRTLLAWNALGEACWAIVAGVLEYVLGSTGARGSSHPWESQRSS